jgi:hypothetical protein
MIFEILKPGLGFNVASISCSGPLLRSKPMIAAFLTD